MRARAPRRAAHRAGLARLALAACGLLAAAACGAFGPPRALQPPQLAFGDLTIDSADLREVRFTVRIDTRNPNPIDLPLSDLRFGLTVLGQPVARGAATEPRFTLPALGSREVPVSMTVATADLRSVLARMSRGPLPEVVWELKGSARWGTTPVAIPFERSGDAASLARLRERLGR
jgi:LEA14-like dessication related protein